MSRNWSGRTALQETVFVGCGSAVCVLMTSPGQQIRSRGTSYSSSAALRTPSTSCVGWTVVAIGVSPGVTQP